MALSSIPVFSEDLINELDTRVPNRWPTLTESDRVIWFQAGQRALVDNLKEVLKRQLEDAMEGGSQLNVHFTTKGATGTSNAASP